MQYIKNFMKYKYLLGELTKKTIKLKYRRSYLGVLWTLLEPLLTMIVMSVVFGTLFGKDDKQFPIYVLTGRLLYSFFSTGTKAAMRSIRSNSGMIRKVYVPKYIYPMASVLSNYVIFAISLIVLAGVSIVLRVPMTIYMLQAFIPLFLIIFMAFGVGLILATLNVFFRDVEYLWSVALMLLSYTSAIFYPVDRLMRTGYAWILKYNPLYALIYNFRCAFYYIKPMDMGYLIYATIFSFGTVFVGLFLFYRNQDKFILHI